MLLKTEKIVTSHQMQEMDRKTISDFGIPGEVLMENAGRTASRVLDNETDLSDKKIVVLCGPGNNGGDGFVMARYLYKRALNLGIILMCNPEKLTGDALLNYKRAEQLNIKTIFCTSNNEVEQIKSMLIHANIIIDALFGTGLRSAPKDRFAQIIELSNSLKKSRVAVDIPSGINADSGKVLETAFKADITITFGFPKPAHYLNPGKTYSGKVFCADIGIPETISKNYTEKMEIISGKKAQEMLPIRDPHSHKGNFGHLALIGGSADKIGACVMASKAAHRAGAGLVTISYPESAKNLSCYSETMRHPLEEDMGEFSCNAVENLKEFLKDKTALVAGPGMGTGKGPEKIMEFILKETKIPVLIDADGLNILSFRRDLLSFLNEKRILTPHPKEMARLTGLSVHEVLENPVKTAGDFAVEYSCNLVLKTSTSIIASPDGRIRINTTGNSGLSAGGSGDILAGTAGAFLANGLSPFDAASASVFINGYSADILAMEKGPFGYLPSEVAENFPKVFKRLQNQS